MKPSERRALKAEKEALKAEKLSEERAAKREKELEAGELYSDDGFYNLDGGDAPVATDTTNNNKHKNTGDNVAPTRKEGFFQSHIRMITFIVCMVLILTVLGPWGIDMLVSRQNDTVEGDRMMTKETVYALYDSVGSITFKSLSDFTYNDLSLKSGYIIREYPIEGTGLVVKIGASTLTGTPDYMHLIDYEYNTPRVDLMHDSPESFFIEYEERKQENSKK